VKNLLAGIAILFCWGITPVSSAEPAFRFSRHVLTAENRQEELLAIQLDSEIFNATQSSLADVQLRDTNGNSVPYLIRKCKISQSRKKRITFKPKQLSVKPLDKGSLEITVVLEPKTPHPTGLKIISPLKNFEHRVRVYTSTDANNWKQIGNEAVIFDYSQFMDVRNDTVSFPETASRMYRIVIDDVTSEQESELLTLTRKLKNKVELERSEKTVINRRPFRIDRLEFWRESKQNIVTGEAKTDYPVNNFEVEQSKNQQTVILFESQRQPLTSLKLITPDKNFSRRAVVLIEQLHHSKSSWSEIGSGTVSRLDFKTLKRENLTVTFPESRKKRYRLTIDNRDNVPVTITGINARGNKYELIFLTNPQTDYQLFYGSDKAKPASYDTTAIQELLQKGYHPKQVRLSAQQASDLANKPAAFQWKQLINNPFILAGVILLLIILLGWSLYQAVKRIDEMPNE